MSPIFLMMFAVLGICGVAFKFAADWVEGLNQMHPDAQKYRLGDRINEAGGVTAGTDYYVDGNIEFNGDGESWDTPYDNLTEALAASHADIADSTLRGWAKRNRIFVKGNKLEEDLDLFAQKTDIIGMGSCDAFMGVGILGNHVPANTCLGTRFFNCNFFPVASEDIMTIGSTLSGLEFHNCRFVGAWNSGDGVKTAGAAIIVTGSPMGKIMDCTFEGAFSDAVIELVSGDLSGMKIVGNTIMGGVDAGIQVTGAVTVIGATSSIMIRGNFVQVATVTIDDNANAGVFTIDNRCISAGAYGATSHVITVETACGNIVTGNNNTLDVPIKAV